VTIKEETIFSYAEAHAAWGPIFALILLILFGIIMTLIWLYIILSAICSCCCHFECAVCVDPRGDDHLGRNYLGTPNAQHGGKRHTKSRNKICRPDSSLSFVRQLKWRGGAWEKHKGENREYFGTCPFPATGTYLVLEMYQKVHQAMINCQVIIFA